MRLALTILLATTVTTHAQTNGTYLLTSSNTVSPTTPTITIEVWAAWTDPTGPPFLFDRGDFDLTASDGIFANPANMRRGTPGTITRNVVSGANIFQIHLPPLGLFGSTDNPILLATYDWSTTDFTPRTVNLHTSNTTTFNVKGLLHTTPLYPGEFTPGSGVITVVPAPGAWLVVALPLIASRRRQRH